MATISTIIPTHNRPQFVRRAIESALASGPKNCVEVIVVPNGLSDDWKEVAEKFSLDGRIKWHPISLANVCTARNHGVEKSSGNFLRFLDDDDYLHPEACKKQYLDILKYNADICSGNVSVVSANDHAIKLLEQPKIDDFFSAVANPQRCAQVGAHVFRKSLITSIKWDESHHAGEDIDWLLKVASSREINWIRNEECVSSWVQHRKPRLSRGRDPGAKTLKYLANSLITSANALESQNRFNLERKVATADGLWSIFQKGFRYDRNYWCSVAQTAESYHPERRPPSAIYHLPITRNLSPIFIETALTPIRAAYHPLRVLMERLNIYRA